MDNAESQSRARKTNVIAFLIVVGVIGALLGNAMMGSERLSKADLALKEEMEILNKDLPMVLPGGIRLDHIFTKGKDLYKEFTLINLLAKDLNMTVFANGVGAKKLKKLIVRIKSLYCY